MQERKHAGHTHPHEPVKDIQPLPEHVMRLIALGQSGGDKGVTGRKSSKSPERCWKNGGLKWVTTSR